MCLCGEITALVFWLERMGIRIPFLGLDLLWHEVHCLDMLELAFLERSGVIDIFWIYYPLPKILASGPFELDKNFGRNFASTRIDRVGL